MILYYDIDFMFIFLVHKDILDFFLFLKIISSLKNCIILLEIQGIYCYNNSKKKLFERLYIYI